MNIIADRSVIERREKRKFCSLDEKMSKKSSVGSKWTPERLPPLNPNEIADILETEPIWDGDGPYIWDGVKIFDEQAQEASGAQNITQPGLATYAGASPEVNASSENFEAQQLEEQNTSKRKPTDTKKKKIKLDDFLWNLLEDPQYNSYIQWTIKDRLEFKLIRPEMVAQLWGEFRDKKLMNYGKLSRGLRFYYESNKIEKVEYKQYHFRFLNRERSGSEEAKKINDVL